MQHHPGLQHGRGLLEQPLQHSDQLLLTARRNAGAVSSPGTAGVLAGPLTKFLESSTVLCGNKAATRPRIRMAAQEGSQKDGPYPSPWQGFSCQRAASASSGGSWSERLEASWYTD
jgi:hypothetical protein